jgi:hypothetical protein
MIPSNILLYENELSNITKLHLLNSLVALDLSFGVLSRGHLIFHCVPQHYGGSVYIHWVENRLEKVVGDAILEEAVGGPLKLSDLTQVALHSITWTSDDLQLH